jgi:hypothetical protein
MVNAPESSSNLKNRLQTILKPEQISDRMETIEHYSHDDSFQPKNSPALVVFPGTKEEVQAIVKMAGETRTPLVPVSSGPPHFRGDTVPENGGIIVDFSRMNKIRKIDPASRYAWLEPGVTFGELVPELKKQDMKLVMPLLPRGNKSVAASRLEREPVTIPKYQYDYLDPLLTLEVIFGMGEEFRTGSASGPGTLETLKADKVNPWGPGGVDYWRFISGAQGTMGLVTWTMTKLEVLPVMQKLFLVTGKDLKAMAEVMNQLLRKRVADECLVLNNVNLAAILSKNRPDDFKKLKKDLPPWTLIIVLAGFKRRPEERISVMEKYLKEICKGVGVNPVTALPGAPGKESDILKLLSGPWQGDKYWKLLPKGACEDLFFLSMLSQAPDFTAAAQKIAVKHRYPADEMGIYIQPMVQGRGCHCEFNLFYDPSRVTEADNVKKMLTAAPAELINSGAFFSRPYGPVASAVYANCPDQVEALKKLKNIFDPLNIFNPGKLCY